MNRLGLRSRVAVLSAVTVAVAVMMTALAGYLVVRSELTAQSDRSLLDHARAVVAATTTGGSFVDDPQAMAAIPAAALSAADIALAVVYPNSTALVSPGAPSGLTLGPPEVAVARGQRATSLRTEHLAGVDYRVGAVPTGNGAALVIVRSLTDPEAVLARVATLSAVIGGLGVLLAAVAGFSVSGAALAPVRRLITAAEDVTRTRRLHPVPVRPGPSTDEVTRLGTAFNAMLTALAQARDSERRLVADAGHELRTPLTSMRTNLELLRQADTAAADPNGPRLSPEDRADLLNDLHTQTTEMADLVGDLVELSRGDLPDTPAVSVDLAAVVTAAAARARRRGPLVEVTVSTRPFPVLADPAALERAVVNIVDNAIRWTPPGGHVTVTQDEGTVVIDDTGPGFAPEDLPHVFERFYRAPAARAQPGSGLGLAIVAQVAERHGGTAGAGRAPTGGARVWIDLPRFLFNFTQDSNS